MNSKNTQKTQAAPLEPLIKTQMIGLSGISIPIERARELRPEKVDELAQSIKAQGLLQPIIVRPHGGIGYVLVAGRHRLEAFRKLDLQHIRAEVREGMEADAAELAEIDENLIRAELTPAEQAIHIGKRKEIYERLHPETKHGAVGRRGKSSRNENSFVNDTAAKTGRGRSTVARDATRYKKVGVLAKTVGTPLDRGDQLDELAKLPPEEQQALVDQAKAGKNVSAKPRPTPRRAAEPPERQGAGGNDVDAQASADQRKAEAAAGGIAPVAAAVAALAERGRLAKIAAVVEFFVGLGLRLSDLGLLNSRLGIALPDPDDEPDPDEDEAAGTPAEDPINTNDPAPPEPSPAAEEVDPTASDRTCNAGGPK